MNIEQFLKQWTPRQRRFIFWTSLPGDLKNPESLEELAEVLGVLPKTLRRWEKLPGFNQAVELLAVGRFIRRLPEVLGVIAEKAEAGDFRFVVMFKDMNEKLRQRFEENVVPLTPEEIYQAQEDVDSWESERFGVNRTPD